MKTLTELSIEFDADKNIYGHNYMPMYEFWLKDRKITSLLEIGFGSGASPKMWKEYYKEANIYIIELFGKEFEETWKSPNTNIEGINIISGDATHPDTWDKVPYDLDIIIDDASHYPNDQIEMFLLGLHHLKSGGLYFIEDCYCNFETAYSKKDILYPWLDSLIHNMQNPKNLGILSRDFYTNRNSMSYPSCDIYSYHIYKNVILFEKA